MKACWSEGQTSNLTHTSRSQQEHSPRTESGQGSLFTWAHGTVILVSPRKEGIPCLTPQYLQLLPGDTSPGSVATVAYSHGSHRTVNNRKRVLKQPSSPGHGKRKQAQELSLLVKEAY